MAYIGKEPAQVKRDLADKNTFTGDGSTTTFDLTNEALSANTIQVFVDNVRQEPGSGKSYTLGEDGSGDLKRITFTVAPDSSAEIYVINEGTRTSVLNTVSCGAIDTGKLGTDAVTGAKIADDAVDSEHLTDGSVDNVHLAGGIADSNLSTITTAGKVNVSALSAPGSTSVFLRGDKSYAAIDVSGIDKNAFNISLLGFKMAVNEGLTVFNLVDGIVDEFHDESGTDESEGSNDTYCSENDMYRNVSLTPNTISAGFTTTTVTEPDTSVAGTNPAQETGTPATFNATEGMTGDLVMNMWGAGGGGGYGGSGTTPGGGGGFVQGTYSGLSGTMNVGVAEGGGGANPGSGVPANTYALFGDHPEPTQSPLPAGQRGGGGAGTYAGGGGLSYATEETALSQGSVPAIVMIAGGGGGGGGHQGSHGGTGGGDTGGDATGSHAGEGGSQTAGGSGSTGAQAGGLLYGGKAKGTQNGGGGGAGYYGGGGGGHTSGPHGAGGGGSGYVGNPQLSSTTSTPSTASANSPGNSSPLYVACTAEGGAAPPSNGSGANGDDGYILFTGTLSTVAATAATTTIVSTAFAAGTVPTTSRIVVFEEDEQTPTLNTDIIASISRDGGSNFTTATLSDSGYVTGASGQRILTGQATISGQPSGQSMRWKLALANNKVKIHGVSLQWA